MAETTETRTEKGISLARGPALILGTILLAAGLYFLYKQHFFPKLDNFPNGRAPVHGKVFLGIFGANGWTGMLTAVGGGLLLFGAAQHLLAKTMSLLVGIALGAAAIIALASGNVLGLAAANHWTELGWGVVAAILLFNSVIPRRRRTVETPVVGDGIRGRRAGAVSPAAGIGPGAANRQEPVAPGRAGDGEYQDTQVRAGGGVATPATEREADGLAPTRTEPAVGPHGELQKTEPGVTGSEAATDRHDPQP